MAEAFTRPGEFLSLPGYEWTSRIPGVSGASLSDPGNWTKPYRNRSFPNHRTVVYPPTGGPLLRYPGIANGDFHRRTPGLAGALTGIDCQTLSPEAILEALRARRCFATNGSKMMIDARANGRLMGHAIETTDRVIELSLTAIGTREITSAVLIRDGKEIKTYSGSGSKTFQARLRDEGLTPGSHWYYWRVSQQGEAAPLPGNMMVAHGHLAWSTPHVVDVKLHLGGKVRPRTR